MEIKVIAIEKPEATNFILGQSHFIKTVEDIHEAIVQFLSGEHQLLNSNITQLASASDNELQYTLYVFC